MNKKLKIILLSYFFSNALPSRKRVATIEICLTSVAAIVSKL